MKVGFALPNIGPVATPAAVKTVAQRAEQLGYNSLSTIERLLWPLRPADALRPHARWIPA